MNPSGNYNWSNTAQWSQVPTTNPTDQNNASYQAAGNGTADYQSNAYSTPNQYPQQPPIQTEPRKDMIERLYRSILGREADTAGLNYYLYNTHITEFQIAKDMYESTEHNEVLQKAKDIREMVRRTEEAMKRMNDMEFTLQSLQVLNENYKNLIDQKTQTINELRARFNLGGEYSVIDQNPSNMHQMHSEFQLNTPQNQTQYSSEQTNVNPEEFFLEDPFADDDKKPGCLGWLQSWFRFR